MRVYALINYDVIISAVFLCLINGCVKILDCESKTITSSVSPSGKKTASIVVKDCGATSLAATSITIHAITQLDNSESEIFSFDGEFSSIRIEWIDDKHLLVKHGAGTISKELKAYLDTSIEYQWKENE